MPNDAILIVDNEPDVLDVFCTMLRRLPYPVIGAAGGPQALEILKTETPRLLILDLAMPEVSGLDIVHLIRQDKRFDQTKVIILSAVPQIMEAHDAKMADLVMTKPVTLREFEKAIKDVIEGN